MCGALWGRGTVCTDDTFSVEGVALIFEAAEVRTSAVGIVEHHA